MSSEKKQPRWLLLGAFLLLAAVCLTVGFLGGRHTQSPAAPAVTDAGTPPVPAASSQETSRLIQDIQTLNDTLPAENLMSLSRKELEQLRDSGAPGMPIGASAAALAAETYAGTMALDSITWDVEPELDEFPAHYEVELHHLEMGDFDYTVDAYTGEVLTGTADILTLFAPSGGSSPYVDGEPAAGAPVSGGFIGEKQAQAIALDHAGVKESAAAFCHVWLEYDNGRPVYYEVEFAADDRKYEYEIGLTDGAVLKSEQEAYHHSQTGGPQDGLIGETAAKAAAFTHAGIRESDITGFQLELDRKDGVYEIDFHCGGVKYEYEIGASNGAIRKAEQEGQPAPAPAVQRQDIGAEAAKQAALDHAGVSAGNVWFEQCELAEEDGLWLYEIEFQAGRTEYEYEIDAATGAVLKAEWDH